jgi:GntR family transcriptional regulator
LVIMNRTSTNAGGTPGTGGTRLPSRRIADDLRAAIESGELTAGQKLPSERELAARYGAARNTAREAFRLLETAGLVDIEHGSGVFVHRPAPLIRLGSDRYSRAFRDSGLSPFLLECAKQGKAGRFEVLSISRTRPPEHVAGTLAIPADWQIAEGTGLLEEDVPHPYGIHGILEDRGHAMATYKESVTSRPASADEERHLRLRPGIWVLDVWHTSFDQDGTPYELTRFVMRADMTGLDFTMTVS